MRVSPPPQALGEPMEPSFGLMFAKSVADSTGSARMASTRSSWLVIARWSLSAGSVQVAERSAWSRGVEAGVGLESLGSVRAAFVDERSPVGEDGGGVGVVGWAPSVRRSTRVRTY